MPLPFLPWPLPFLSPFSTEGGCRSTPSASKKTQYVRVDSVTPLSASVRHSSQVPWSGCLSLSKRCHAPASAASSLLFFVVQQLKVFATLLAARTPAIHTRTKMPETPWTPQPTPLLAPVTPFTHPPATWLDLHPIHTSPDPSPHQRTTHPAGPPSRPQLEPQRPKPRPTTSP